MASIAELEKELAEIEDDIFYIDMKDRWTDADSDRHTKLFRRKLEIKEEIRSKGVEM